MQRTMLIYVSCQLVDNRLKNPPPTTTTTTTKVGKAQERKARTIGANWYQLSGPAPAAVSESSTYHSFHFIVDFVRGFYFDSFCVFILDIHSWFFCRFFRVCLPHAMQKVWEKLKIKKEFHGFCALYTLLLVMLDLLESLLHIWKSLWNIKVHRKKLWRRLYVWSFHFLNVFIFATSLLGYSLFINVLNSTFST